MSRHVGWCEVHAKRLFASRGEARQARNDMQDSTLRAYPCTAVDGMFHLGHKPQAVMHGRLTAREVYGTTGGDQ